MHPSTAKRQQEVRSSSQRLRSAALNASKKTSAKSVMDDPTSPSSSVPESAQEMSRKAPPPRRSKDCATITDTVEVVSRGLGVLPENAAVGAATKGGAISSSVPITEEAASS